MEPRTQPVLHVRDGHQLFRLHPRLHEQPRRTAPRPPSDLPGPPNSPDHALPMDSLPRPDLRASEKFVACICVEIAISCLSSAGVSPATPSSPRFSWFAASDLQERELAERYKAMSETVRAKWPRTSALLRSLSDMYRRQAKREDIDSDLRDFRWD